MRQDDVQATIAAVVEAGARIEKDLGFGPTIATEVPEPAPRKTVPRARRTTAVAA
jgi:hypothetical protein